VHWAGAARAGDLIGLGAHHSKDIAVFDVGSPRVAQRGIQAR
jgi:ketosteroid isomerase-like protein